MERKRFNDEPVLSAMRDITSLNLLMEVQSRVDNRAGFQSTP